MGFILNLINRFTRDEEELRLELLPFIPTEQIPGRYDKEWITLIKTWVGHKKYERAKETYFNRWGEYITYFNKGLHSKKKPLR